MKKIFSILIIFISLSHGATRPAFDPFGTLDWGFFADNFKLTIKACSCSVGDIGVIKAGFEVSMYEPIALIDVTAKPWNFPSIGISLNNSLSRKQGVSRNGSSDGQGANAFKYTHFIAYPVMSVINIVTDSICFEKLSVITFGFMGEVNPAWNNDSLAAFLNPHKLLFALASPACIADCAYSTLNNPLNSMYFCAGCWQTLGTNTGFTEGQHPVTEAGTLAVRLLDDMHKTYSLTKSSNALFKSTTTNSSPKGSMCKETFFPIVLKSQYKLQLAYPVTTKAVTIGKSRTGWADFRLGKDLSEDMAWWLWRKRDQCAGAYDCKSTFGGK